MSDLFGERMSQGAKGEKPEEQPDGQPLVPEAPFLWPEHRVLAETRTYRDAPPWEQLLQDAKSLCGMVTELGESGVDFLERVLKKNPSLKAKLVLVLYPACQTSKRELSKLLGIIEAVGDRLQVRLYLLPYIEDIPFHSLLMMPGGASARPILLTGPAGNLGLEDPRPDRVNLVTTPDAATLESWTRWFNWLWAIHSVRLRDDITGVPELVRPQGTEEARLMWEDFMAACDSQEEPAVEVVVNRETGEIEARVPPEELEGKTPEEQKQIKEEAQKKLPTVAMGMPRMDATADRVARLFQKGSLATIDKSTRVKPLSVPISPKSFGMEAEERSGRILQKTSYSVSIFDEDDQKKIENLRKSIGTLLSSLSYPLADGVRWVPDSAKALLAKEIEKRNQDAGGVLAAKVGDIDDFLKTIEPTIQRDAQRVYERMMPGERMNNKMLSQVMGDIRLRVQAAMSGPMLPRITYMPVEFRPMEGDGNATSSWGGAYKLLLHIARYPADVAKEGKFFERGFLASKPEEVTKAMDVLGHAWFRQPEALADYKKAREEWIPIFEALEESTALLAARCRALLSVIDTGKTDEIQALTDQEEPGGGSSAK